jgi:hypothetical protein
MNYRLKAFNLCVHIRFFLRFRATHPTIIIGQCMFESLKIESINQICLKLHSSDSNLHMFACRVSMWWGSKGTLFDTWRGYLLRPIGFNYLDVFKEKKPKCHYVQNYDL